MTPLQEKTTKAIVNVFETGHIRGNYGAVTVLKGDKGHLTYGRSQTTLASGQLFLLLKEYCATTDAEFADAIRAFLPRLAAMDVTLDQDMTLRGILHAAGDDPVMRTVQDTFFTQRFFDPACSTASAWGIAKALGQAVVYDSFIQGGAQRIHDKVVAKIGRIGGAITQEQWIQEWIQTRKAWLLGLDAPLPSTIYRMESFNNLIGQGADKWDLALPIAVHGVTIDEASLGDDGGGLPVVRASSMDPQPPLLHLANPYLAGDEVRALQKALAEKGLRNTQDGVFGPFTEALVKQFQRSQGLPPDGVVGPRTAEQLGLT